MCCELSGCTVHQRYNVNYLSIIACWHHHSRSTPIFPSSPILIDSLLSNMNHSDAVTLHTIYCWKIWKFFFTKADISPYKLCELFKCRPLSSKWIIDVWLSVLYLQNNNRQISMTTTSVYLYSFVTSPVDEHPSDIHNADNSLVSYSCANALKVIALEISMETQFHLMSHS